MALNEPTRRRAALGRLDENALPSVGPVPGKRKHHQAQQQGTAQLQSALARSEAEVKRMFGKLQLVTVENEELRASLHEAQANLNLQLQQPMAGGAEDTEEEMVLLQDDILRLKEEKRGVEEQVRHEAQLRSAQRVQWEGLLALEQERCGVLLDKLEECEAALRDHKKLRTAAVDKARLEWQAGHRHEVSLLDKQLQALQAERDASSSGDSTAAPHRTSSTKDRELASLRATVAQLEAKITRKNSALDVATMELERLSDVLESRARANRGKPVDVLFLDRNGPLATSSPSVLEPLQAISRGTPDSDAGSYSAPSGGLGTSGPKPGGTSLRPSPWASGDARTRPPQPQPQMQGPTWDAVRATSDPNDISIPPSNRLNDPEYCVAV